MKDVHSTFWRICLFIPQRVVYDRMNRGPEVKLTCSCMCTSSSCCVVLDSSSNFPECLFTQKKWQQSILVVIKLVNLFFDSVMVKVWVSGRLSWWSHCEGDVAVGPNYSADSLSHWSTVGEEHTDVCICWSKY